MRKVRGSDVMVGLAFGVCLLGIFGVVYSTHQHHQMQQREWEEARSEGPSECVRFKKLAEQQKSAWRKVWGDPCTGMSAEKGAPASPTSTPTLAPQAQPMIVALPR